MRSGTSRFSRETFRFSWSLSSFAETFRFSKPLDFSLSLWPAAHSFNVQFFGRPTTLIYCAEISWPATWMIECLFGFSCGFSLLVRRLGSRWNLSFLGMSLRYFLLFCGRPPLLINSQVHSTNWLTLFLRENPKFSREEKPSVGWIFEAENSKRKECGREKRKENCSHFDFQ